jgi:hypothetical protein
LHNLQSAAAIDNNRYNKTRERERASASCRAQGFMKKLQKKNTFHKQSRWAWWVPKVCFAQSAISYCKLITTDQQTKKKKNSRQTTARERERERERAVELKTTKLRKIQQHSRCKKSSRRANTLYLLPRKSWLVRLIAIKDVV